MTPRSEYDVIVIGAGPAGSTSARRLAQAGLAVLLVDRETFPRDKPCGNLIAGSATRELDFALPESIIQGRCKGANLFLPGARHVEFRVPYEIAVYVYRRDFDQFLLSKALEAGVEFVGGSQSKRIDAISETLDGVSVRFRDGSHANAPYLVGADGATGITSLEVRRRKWRKFELGVAIYAMCPKTVATSEKYPDDLLTLDLEILPGGYAWIFPQGGYFNAGMGAPAITLKEPRQTLKRLLLEFGLDGVGAMKSHPLPAGGIPRRIASRRILLTGDAAGLVDTLSGDGITNAVRSGGLAAASIVEGLRIKVSASSIYMRKMRKTVLPELRAALLFNVYLLLFKSVFRRLRPEYTKMIFERQFAVVAGRMTYREFVRWAIPRIPYFAFFRPGVERKSNQ